MDCGHVGTDLGNGQYNSLFPMQESMSNIAHGPGRFMTYEQDVRAMGRQPDRIITHPLHSQPGMIAEHNRMMGGPTPNYGVMSCDGMCNQFNCVGNTNRLLSAGGQLPIQQTCCIPTPNNAMNHPGAHGAWNNYSPDIGPPPHQEMRFLGVTNGTEYYNLPGFKPEAKVPAAMKSLRAYASKNKQFIEKLKKDVFVVQRKAKYLHYYMNAGCVLRAAMFVNGTALLDKFKTDPAVKEELPDALKTFSECCDMRDIVRVMVYMMEPIISNPDPIPHLAQSFANPTRSLKNKIDSVPLVKHTFRMAYGRFKANNHFSALLALMDKILYSMNAKKDEALAIQPHSERPDNFFARHDGQSQQILDAALDFDINPFKTLSKQITGILEKY